MSARARLHLETHQPQSAKDSQAVNNRRERRRGLKPPAWESAFVEQPVLENARGHHFAEMAVQAQGVPPEPASLQTDQAQPADLQAIIQHITRQPGTGLPHRAELEALLGQTLDGVEVYSGEAARQLLQLLGARAAVQGDKLLLSEADPGLEVLLHEAVHLLQGRQVTGTGEPAAGVEVVPLDSPVEEEARRVEQYLRETGRPDAGIDAAPRSGGVQVENSLSPEELALQRAEPAEAPTETLQRPRRPGIESWVVAPGLSAEQRFEQSVEAAQPAGATQTRRPRAEQETQATTEPAVEAAAPSGSPIPEEAPSEAGLAAAEAPGAAAPDVAAQEQARAQAEAALQGAEDVSGLVDAYAAAPPTVKARQAAEMNSRAGDLSQQETQSLEESIPEFHAELNTQVESAPPLQVETPASRDVSLEDSPPAPVELPELPPTPDPGRYDANDSVVSGIERLFGSEGGDASAEIGESLSDVRTTDPEIPTSPGPPPAIPLEGETDPSRLEEQTANSAEQGRQVRDEARQAVLDGPGPEQVQPQQMDEVVAVGGLERPVFEAPPAAPAGERESPEAYLAMDLPPEVQAQFDQDQQGAMQTSMAEAQTQVGQATQERDQQRQEQVDQAEAETQRLSEEADEEQRSQVQSSRQDIQDERQSTIDQQNEAVGNLERDAENRRQEDRESIDGRVREDQGQIEGRYTQAETDANREIQEGEQEAEQRRERAEREASEQSWWERAVNFVRDAFNALVSAISAIFDAVRAAVNAVLDAAKAFAEGLIAAVADFIKSAIAVFGEFLKGLVDALLGDIFPGLAAALNAFIDEAVAAAQSAVDAVADALKNAVNALIEGLRAGLNSIINAFQAGIQLGLALLQAALTGDWSGLALKILESVLRLVGVSPEDFYAFIGRATETIQIIIDDPGGFVGNLIDAFLNGVRQFGTNFLVHLQTAIIEWLTGALGGTGITLPESFDLMGVLSLVQQILGLTWDRLREKAVRLIGEQNVAILEHVYSYIETLVTGGWSALFERIVQDLSGLVDTVLDGIRNFLVERIIVAAITRLATLFNPVGAIVQLLMAAWNLYTFLRDQLARIIQVVQTVVDAIGNIARGVIEPAANAVESTLGRLLTFAIDLLARFLGLGGIAERVREIIENVRARVDSAIERLLERVRAAFRGGRGAAAEGEGPEATEAGAGTAAPAGEQPVTDAEGNTRIERTFQLSGTTHHLYILIQNNQMQIEVASTRQRLEQLRQIVSGVIREQAGSRGANDEVVTFLRTLETKIDGLIDDEDVIRRIGYNEQRTQEEIDRDATQLIQAFEAVGQAANIHELEDIRSVIDESAELLQQAVESEGIVEFMKKMSRGETVNRIDRPLFINIFNDPSKQIGTTSARDWIKNTFRNVRKGTHEWIPTSVIDDVVLRASNGTEALGGVRWIELQNELRTDTRWVVFKADRGDQIVLNQQRYTILNGHAGAIYLNDVEKSAGEPEFHNDLRGAYRGQTQIPGVMDSLKQVFENWVWRGSDEPLPYPPHPQMTGHGLPLNVPANVRTFERRQKTEYDRTDRMFDDIKSRFSQ